MNWDKTKIHVVRRPRGVVSSYAGGLGQVFEAFFGTGPSLESPEPSWYVVYWSNLDPRWVYRECRDYPTATAYAAAIAHRAREKGRTSGKWDVASAATTIARDWQKAATPVAVTAL